MWQWAVGLAGLAGAGWYFNEETKKLRVGDTVIVPLANVRFRNAPASPVTLPPGTVVVNGDVQLYVSNIIDGWAHSDIGWGMGSAPIKVEFPVSAVRVIARAGKSWPGGKYA